MLPKFLPCLRAVFTKFSVKILLIAAALCYNLIMANKKIKLHFGKVSIILLLVCAALIAVDLILKHFEEAQGWQFTVIPGFIWVEYGKRNPGAAFSFLADAEWGQTFLTLFSIVLLVALITAFVFIPERFVVLKTALVMIVAGAIGNLVDRAAFGEVRDFVWVGIGSWGAYCNFADFFIVFGVIIAVIDFLFLNEWALIPLTKRAKAAQAKHEDVQIGHEEQSAANAEENDGEDGGYE